MKTVYIEMIFVLNLIMNFFLLRLTEVIMKKPTTLGKVLKGSVIGAFVYCISLLFHGKISIHPVILMIPTSVWVCRVVFGGQSAGVLFRQTGYLYLTGCFLGGSLLMLKRNIPGLWQMKNSFLLIAGSGAAVYEFGRLWVMKLYKRNKEVFCKVSLQGDSEVLEIMALVDTGNGLVDPVSGKRVAVLEKAVFQKMTLAIKPEKLKMIPYHSLGKERGILTAYEVEKIEIRKEEEKQIIRNVILAIYEGKLSGKGSYQMILSPELLQEAKVV